jgi:hypothetical protein
MAIANRGSRRVWQGHRPLPGGRFTVLCCAGSARFGHAGYQTGKREERMAQISGAAGTIRGCPLVYHSIPKIISNLTNAFY